MRVLGKWWVLGLLLGGCAGEIGEAGDGIAFAPGETSTGGGPTGPAFTLPLEQVRLLPFSVRLQKLAAVVGRPAADPLFDDVRAKRFQLGDFDYAGGVVPDLSWSASRMSVWVQALGPICESQPLRERYPTLASTDLDAFVLAAHGRDLEASERAELDAALASIALDAEGRRLALCRAVLSSLEFVSL